MEQKLNEKILKTYFPGIFGLAPIKPKSRKPIVGKVSDSRIVKKVTPTYP